MSREIDEARRLFNERMKQAGNDTLYGIIEKVDESSRTCDVKVGGVIYDNVLLYAIEKIELKGAVLIPKIGSGVLLGRVGTSTRRFVEMFSVIDKVLLTIGNGLELVIDQDGLRLTQESTLLRATSAGFVIKRGGSGLKKTLADILDAICNLRVPTNSGASDTPINKETFKRIKQDLNNYLED